MRKYIIVSWVGLNVKIRTKCRDVICFLEFVSINNDKMSTEYVYTKSRLVTKVLHHDA